MDDEYYNSKIDELEKEIDKMNSQQMSQFKEYYQRNTVNHSEDGDDEKRAQKSDYQVLVANQQILLANQQMITAYQQMISAHQQLKRNKINIISLYNLARLCNAWIAKNEHSKTRTCSRVRLTKALIQNAFFWWGYRRKY
jgi:hypothetical protein